MTGEELRKHLKAVVPLEAIRSLAKEYGVVERERDIVQFDCDDFVKLGLQPQALVRHRAAYPALRALSLRSSARIRRCARGQRSTSPAILVYAYL